MPLGLVPRNALRGSAERSSESADKVNPLWPNPGLLIVLHSPKALPETGLRMCPPEKNQDSCLLRCRAARSLRSRLSSKYREKRACFAYFGERGGGISLQSRLRGGGRG